MRTVPIAVLAVALAGCSSSVTSRPSPEGPPAPQTTNPKAPAPSDGDEVVLWDGKSLTNWTATEFGGEGEVTVEDGKLVLGRGGDLTGVTWKGPPLPRTNYEVTLEAMKVEGSDFFCGIAFPVGEANASFVAGGWGGGVCGISSLDGAPAAENETTTIRGFDKGRWYHFRLRVTPEKILVWLDGEKIVDVELKGRQVSIHPAMEASLPFGLTSFATTAAYRNIRLRKLSGGAAAGP